jgi:hypothetical protein
MTKVYKTQRRSDNINATAIKQSLARVKFALKLTKGGGQQPLEVLMGPYLEDRITGDQKLINIRSLKVFLLINAGRTLTPQEIENLVEHLDKD